MKSLNVLLLSTLIASPVWQATAQTAYVADGVPTGLEEEIRWRVNRGRFDSTSENQTRGTSYADIPATAGPLAPSQSLTLAARHQSEDMARNNVFQHATVTGSAYYDPVTQPNPWDRMKAEGYSWNAAAENIAAGYAGAEAAYVGWWNSTGHRLNMYNSSLREIGDGYYYFSSSSYHSYYTMDLGSSGNHSFFTDTIFLDANGNGLYDQNEGVGGVTVTLLVAGRLFDSWDMSSVVGSFAVPIQTIPGGSSVQVIFSNSTPGSVNVSIPRDYHNFTAIALAAGASRVVGTFTQPSTPRNFGLRNLAPPLLSSGAPRITITPSSGSLVLAWPTENGVSYQTQWTTNFSTWYNLGSGVQLGTGVPLSCSDGIVAGPCQRFYRLLILQ